MTSLTVAFLCVTVQVILTFWAIIRMGMARVESVKTKQVHIKDIAIDKQGFPEQVKLYSNNAHNQFETPPLLYAVVALGVAMNVMNWGIAGFAVLYVSSRIYHRVIHVGSNNIRYRFMSYVFGLVALLGCWISLVIGYFVF